MKDFRSLKVWEKSHEFTLRIFKATQSFPKEELYGITSQLRRAVSSIPTNLAEGCGRGSDKDFARFAQIAFGSACEVEYLIILCSDLGFMKEKDFTEYLESIVEIKKMLSSLLKSLR